MAVANLLEVRAAGTADSYKVSGTDFRSPSAITWSIQDISSPDAGRTLDGIMHKERLAVGGQKRKLKLTWNMVRYGTESSTILQAFTPEYVDVKYPDPQTGSVETKVFYTGDKELEFKTWWSGSQILTNLSFSIIEQ